MTVLSLADDATGALEVGAQFARHGIAARVWFGDESPRRGGTDASTALVIDTCTRHLTALEAHGRVRRLAVTDARHVFKKTDSTLRGNIAAEFRALRELFPERPLVYAPAYPALGRTVKGGELLVDGKPLAESAFANDPLNPVRNGVIPELLADCGAPVRVIAHPSELASALAQYGVNAVYVCDGATDDDLSEIAAALHGCAGSCLAAGPGAFAGHWIRPLAGSIEPRHPVARRCLVVNGSLHPVSRRQAELAAAGDWPVMTTPFERLADPPAVARRMGESVRNILERDAFDGLVVFGGDTLRAIFGALGIEVVEACDELLPGVPLSRALWRNRELALITKAGGFGAPQIVRSIRERLEK